MLVLKKKPFYLLFISVAIFAVAAAFLLTAKAKSQDIAIDSFSATITWATDKPCTSAVDYGQSLNYDHKTPPNTALVTQHTVTISDLKPSTRYHYRVRSRDAFGNEAVSSDFTFVTNKVIAADEPPKIFDIAASPSVIARPSGQVVRATPGSKPSSGPGISFARATVLSDEQAKTITGAGPLSQDDNISGGGTLGGGETSIDAVQLIKKEASIEEALTSKGGLLLPKGTWQFEPAITYAHVTTNRIALQGVTVLPVLVVGEIDVEEAKRDIVINTETFRYGIGNNFQWDLKVPFKYQYDRVSISDTSERTRETSGLGDIESGLSYHLIHEDGAVPDVVVGVSVKSDTGDSPYDDEIGIGTGHWATKFNVVWVKSADPAILFGSFGYTWNIERDIDNFGDVDPGNTIDYSLGTAFALNYYLSLSFSVEQLISQKMTIDDVSVPGSFTNAASFKSGVSWVLSENLSLQLTAAYGLTEDAPDYVLELRFPYTF